MNFAIRLLALACALLISGALHAQRLMLAPPPPKVNVLAGVIDMILDLHRHLQRHGLWQLARKVRSPGSHSIVRVRS